MPRASLKLPAPHLQKASYMWASRWHRPLHTCVGLVRTSHGDSKIAWDRPDQYPHGMGRPPCTREAAASSRIRVVRARSAVCACSRTEHTLERPRGACGAVRAANRRRYRAERACYRLCRSGRTRRTSRTFNTQQHAGQSRKVAVRSRSAPAGQAKGWRRCEGCSG